MALLRDVGLKAVYQSDEDDLLGDFYVPALKASVSYDRAVGFFSGAMLSYAAQGLSTFVENGGRMRLVVGGELDEDDTAAIASGYDLRAIERKLGLFFVKQIEAIDDSLFQARLELLSWLVASGRLDVKVALKRRGMFHSKIGIMTDEANDRVVFQGSANETGYALLPDFNFETVNVFPSWRRELAEHFEPHVRTFDRLWRNEAANTLVVGFPEAARDKLVAVAKRARVAKPQMEEALWLATLERHAPARPSGQRPRLPETLGGDVFALKEHQRTALTKWRAAGWQGMLALATGSGKTVTAIYGAVRVHEQLSPMCLVIAVPYRNLADQWLDNLKLFGIGAFACYGGIGTWRDDVDQALQLHLSGAWPLLCLVVVNRTLCGDAFQGLLGRVPGKELFFVGDECHHHGAERANATLPRHAAFRLGLSATPDHYMDDAANQRLEGYYGRVVDKYGLDEALQDGILTPYRYSVRLVDLTSSETDVYAELSDQISRLAAAGNGITDEGGGSTQLQRLLLERSRVLGGAENKMAMLDSLLAGRAPSPHMLFYCSDATLAPNDDEEDWEDGRPRTGGQRQVEAVSTLLRAHGWKAARFTAREGGYERQRILAGFRLGDIDALVAIRCLDEGIDVPACKGAFILASSRNPRQFIQRRGRILRRSPGKHIAEIVDLMVKIPDEVVETSPVERKLLAAELARVAEFARLARNAGEVIETLTPLLQRHDLDHHLA